MYCLSLLDPEPVHVTAAYRGCSGENSRAQYDQQAGDVVPSQPRGALSHSGTRKAERCSKRLHYLVYIYCLFE